MKYWITTQWPHLLTQRRDAPHNGVWVRDEKRQAIAGLAVGDLVWIYESQSGRAIVRESADGATHVSHRHPGRGGIVTLVQVVAPPDADLATSTEHYADGSSAWWRWHAETRIIDSSGFVPRASLNDILGFKRTHALRGFGIDRSGLAEISLPQHEAIKAAFGGAHAERDRERLAAGRRRGSGGPGGEGPVHLALKQAIAADPARVLNEPGLRLVQMEFPFGATGDRIDVLLTDSLGRYVAVEVEPACPPDHIAGPLQAMKYRSLLAYLMDRDPGEVRTMLVTHALDAAVRTKCEVYEIECVVVPAAQVTAATVSMEHS